VGRGARGRGGRMRAREENGLGEAGDAVVKLYLHGRARAVYAPRLAPRPPFFADRQVQIQAPAATLRRLAALPF
jgi:hypothetical protein